MTNLENKLGSFLEKWFPVYLYNTIEKTKSPQCKLLQFLYFLELVMEWGAQNWVFGFPIDFKRLVKTRPFFYFLPNFWHIWYFLKFHSTFNEKSSNMPKIDEKSCSTCLKFISHTQKPFFRYPMTDPTLGITPSWNPLLLKYY